MNKNWIMRTCKTCKQSKPLLGGYNHPQRFKCADCLAKEKKP